VVTETPKLQKAKKRLQTHVISKNVPKQTFNSSIMGSFPHPVTRLMLKKWNDEQAQLKGVMHIYSNFFLIFKLKESTTDGTTMRAFNPFNTEEALQITEEKKTTTL
jgi:hypothetical protein